MQFPSDTKYWYLRNHRLFSSISSTELKEICLITNFKTAKKGEIIYFAHDEAKRVYTIKQGILKIVEIDSEGRETVKEILQAGDLFGQFDLENATNDESAIVLSEQVTVCSFRIEDFEKTIQKNPDLALRYTKLIGVRFRKLENRYANLMFKDVRSRFLLFLKDWVAKEAPELQNNIVLKNYLTHQDIASLICSTRQTVSQLFNEFKQNGILDYSRNSIAIPHLKNLV